MACVPFKLVRIAGDGGKVWRIAGNESYKVWINQETLSKDQWELGTNSFPSGVYDLDSTWMPWLNSIPTWPDADDLTTFGRAVMPAIGRYGPDSAVNRINTACLNIQDNLATPQPGTPLDLIMKKLTEIGEAVAAMSVTVHQLDSMQAAFLALGTAVQQLNAKIDNLPTGGTTIDPTVIRTAVNEVVTDVINTTALTVKA